MVNKNYLKGKAKEHRLKKKYEKEGWIVLRSAGSKGFADLVAIKQFDGKIRFIQSKPKNFSLKAKQKLLEQWSWLNDEFMVDFVVE